jgi:CDP-glycerol glycerophosphotransferase
VSDPRLTLVDAGSGRIERVDGDYVAFLDTRRGVPAIEELSTRLLETRPDVLLLDPPPGAPRGAFSVEEWPPALDCAPGLADKILRCAFLRDLEVDLAEGDFGELPLTYTALLAAARIAVCERGALPASGKSRADPFAVFPAYDRVFEAADARATTLDRRLRLLPVSMLLHYLRLIGDVPDDRRTEFFGLMAASYAQRARGDETVSPERRSAFYARRTAQSRHRGAGLRTRAIDAVRRAKRTALTGYYVLQLRRPVDPDLAVFAAYWYSSYACNPRGIYEKLRELLPRVRGIWVVDREHAETIPAGVPHVVAGTREYLRLVARAKWFVNNVGFPDAIVKREGTIRVHTHHGTPVKTMGLDLQAAFVAGARTDFERQRRRWARWDYSITQNRFTTARWEGAYPAAYETLEVGYPRNDMLATATEADVERVRRALGLGAGQCSVLYAPTQREYLPHADPTLRVEALAEALGSEYTVLSRAHYLDGSSRRGQAEGVVDVTDYASIEELLLAADVLITDYSSAMFDYGVLDRPIVIYAPDWEIYRTLRGTYFDLLAEPPGVVATTETHLVDAFLSGAVWGDPAARLRALFRARFCYLDDGFAAERVVRRVWLGENGEEA